MVQEYEGNSKHLKLSVLRRVPTHVIIFTRAGYVVGRSALADARLAPDRHILFIFTI